MRTTIPPLTHVTVAPADALHCCATPIGNWLFHPVVWCWGVALVCLTIIVSTTVALSFNNVEYFQVALLQNRYGTVDLTAVYAHQRKFLPLTQYLVTFPSTYQALDYVAPVFTPDGLQFDVEVLFYYKLDPSTLPSTYQKYSRNYDVRVQSIATTTIKNLATNFTVDDYLHSRRAIEAVIGGELQRALASDVGVAVPSRYFRVMSLTLPSTLLQTSLQSAIELQNNQVQQFQQTVSLVEAETAHQVAVIGAQAERVLSYANTEADKLVTQAQQFSDNLLLAARGAGLQVFFDALNVTDPALKIRFVNTFAALDASNAKILRVGSTAAFLNV